MHVFATMAALMTVILGIHLSSGIGWGAATAAESQQPRHHILPAITNLAMGSMSTNWPPVAVLAGSNCVMIGAQADMMFGTVLASFERSKSGNGALLAIAAPRFDNPLLRRNDSGAVFFFKFHEATANIALAGMLESSRAGAAYGQSIASIDDLIGDGFSELLIGAPNFRVSQGYEGAWFLVHGPEPWREQNPEPMVASGNPNAKLGVSVAAAGDVNGDGWPDVIVGARSYLVAKWREGGAFLYFGSSNGVVRPHSWSAHGDERQAQFGTTVASAGDVNGDGFADVLVGAPRSSKLKPDAGRVYLYLGSPSGLGREPAWTADGPAPFAFFGAALASLGDIDGDGLADVVVGAPGSDREASDWPGQALIYCGTTNGLAATPSLVLNGKSPRSMFGAQFATRGDLNGDRIPDLLVGAPRFSGDQAIAGRVSLFLGHATGISSRPSWTLDGGQAGALCGSALSFVRDLNGDGCDELLIGSPRYTAVKSREGRVDLLFGSPNGYGAPFEGESQTPSEEISGTLSVIHHQGFTEIIGPTKGAGDLLLAFGVGDVNGDGFADVLAVTPRSLSGRGEAFLLPGSSNGIAARPTTHLSGVESCRDLAERVVAVGDANHDGFADVLVSFRLQGNSSEQGTPQWCLLPGAASGLSAAPLWATTNLNLTAKFGGSFAFDFALGGAGDFNKDGFIDLVLNATGLESRDGRRDGVLVFYGSARGFGLEPDWIAQSEQTNSAFGSVFCNAGDVNGDGIDDLAVTAPMFTHRYYHSGKVYVYYGSRNGLSPSNNWSAIYELPVREDVDEPGAQHFGAGITSGDLNGDGFSDLIIGAPYADRGDINEGLAFAYYGSRSGLSKQPDWWIESNHAHATLGKRMAVLRHMNGDGLADLLVSAPDATGDQMKEGAVLLFPGAKAGLSRTPAWCRLSHLTETRFGVEVSAAGDINRDGFADAVVCSSSHWKDAQNVGRAVIFYGSASGFGPSSDWSLDKPLLLAANQELGILHRQCGPWLYAVLFLLFLGITAVLVRIRRAVLRRQHATSSQFTSTAVETERQRLARDLHDDLGAKLTSIAVLTELVRRESASHEGGRQNAQLLTQTAQEVLASMEQLIWSVNPANDTLENLVLFIVQYAGPFLAPTGIELLPESPATLPDRPLPANLRKNVFLSVKEALNNVVKHSKATKVGLRIKYEAPVLIIVIEDDGQGVRARGAGDLGHIQIGSDGLKNMRDRMGEAGGTFVIDERPEGGTRVTLRVRV